MIKKTTQRERKRNVENAIISTRCDYCEGSGEMLQYGLVAGHGNVAVSCIFVKGDARILIC